MAITYKELRRLIRYKLKDNNEVRFSDYEIKEAFNECLRFFNSSYALQNSDFLEKAVTYDEEKMNAEIRDQNAGLPEEEQFPLYDFKFKGLDLPNDFITLQHIMREPDGYIMQPVSSIKDPLDWQYKITGNKLYLGCPTVKMLYKAAIIEVKDETDVLELPIVFKDALVKITCMILENTAGTDVMADAVDDVVSRIVPRRRYANARIKMPWKV